MVRATWSFSFWRRILHASSSGIGVIFTSAAVGALLGNIASIWARKRFRFGTITISMLWLESADVSSLRIVPNVLVMCLVAAAEEFVAPIYTVSLDTYRLMITLMHAWPREQHRAIGDAGSPICRSDYGGVLIQEVGANWEVRFY